MREVMRIINILKETSSINDKLNILKANKDNETLKKVLEYTYNPFKRYGFSENKLMELFKNMKDKKIIIHKNRWNSIFEMLDELSQSNINDSLRNDVLGFISNDNLPPEKQEELDLYGEMLLKDLKINLGAKSINKIWKGLIPSFNVMLAEKYFEKAAKVEGKEFIITQKLDGGRFVLIKDHSGNVKFFTRQGQEVTNLPELEQDSINIPNNTVIDGELLLNRDDLHSKDLYRETMKEMRKKGEKHNLVLHAFDIMTFDEFKEGKSKANCKLRKELLHSFLSTRAFNYIKEVPIRYIGKDTSMIIKLLDEAIANDEEGVMVNLSDTEYLCKRTSNILKVKKFQDADLKVLDMIEGTGKNKGKLGAITVQFEHEGNLYTCDCGSGFNDDERLLYWNNPELILSKIVTIGYFEVSQNSKTKEFALRFPVWKSIIRDDKTEISMY